MDTIKIYMRTIGVCVENEENKEKWRFRKRVVDQKLFGLITLNENNILKMYVKQLNTINITKQVLEEIEIFNIK